MQCEFGRHAGMALEIHHFAPHVVVRDERAGGIGAQAYGNAIGKRLTRRGGDAFVDDAAVDFLHMGRVRFLGRKHREGECRRERAGERRGVAEPVFLEQLQKFVGKGRAMLDGVDACFQSDLDAFGAFNMGRGAKPEFMRLVAHRLRDIERHAQNARFAFDFGIENAARDEKLDLIGAIAEVLMNERAALFGGRCFFREQARMAFGNGDAAARCDKARTLEFARFDLVAHLDIGISGVADAAHGGYAACELVFQRRFQHVAQNRHADGIARDFLNRPFGVARTAGRAVANQVHVHIDEPGHEVLALQIDDLLAAAHFDFGGRADLDDFALVIDENRRVGRGLHFLRAVEHRGVDECVRHKLSSLNRVTWIVSPAAYCCSDELSFLPFRCPLPN